MENNEKIIDWEIFKKFEMKKKIKNANIGIGQRKFKKYFILLKKIK